jgi:hypothetical protein
MHYNRCPIADLPEDLLQRVSTRPTVIVGLRDTPPPQSAAELQADIKSRRSASLSSTVGSTSRSKGGDASDKTKATATKANTVTPAVGGKANQSAGIASGKAKKAKRKTFAVVRREQQEGGMGAVERGGTDSVSSSWREESTRMTSFFNAFCCPQLVLDPFSEFRVRWDMLVGALVVYSVLIIPLRFGFSVSYCFTEAPFIFDCVVDTFFAMDIVLNFNTAFESTSKELVTDKQRICRHYLKGWFPVDFFSTMPIGTVY